MVDCKHFSTSKKPRSGEKRTCSTARHRGLWHACMLARCGLSVPCAGPGRACHGPARAHESVTNLSGVAWGVGLRVRAFDSQRRRAGLRPPMSASKLSAMGPRPQPVPPLAVCLRLRAQPCVPGHKHASVTEGRAPARVTPVLAALHTALPSSASSHVGVPEASRRWRAVEIVSPPSGRRSLPASEARYPATCSRPGRTPSPSA